MRRIYALVASTMAGLALLLPGTSAATTTPTITGPDTVPYYTTVTITGTTPTPDQDVTIYFKGPGFTTWTARRHLHSDTAGDFSTTYTATATYSYYAMSQSVASPIHTTHIVTADCHVTRAAFTKLPFPNLERYSPPLKAQDAYAGFTTTRDGLWAGYAFLSYPTQFAAITWRSGQARPTVLYRVYYGEGSYDPNFAGSMDVVGITPSGAVVAAVQTVGTHSEGLSWYKGHTYHLSKAASWVNVHPSGVADNGRILGWARSVSEGHSRYYLVAWRSSGAHYEVLRYYGRTPPGVLAVDGRGDVAYNRYDGSVGALMADGSVRTLVGPPDQFPSQAQAQVGSGRWIVGDQRGLVRWDLGAAPATGPIASSEPLAGPANNVMAPSFAGVRGDIVEDGNGHEYLRTAPGALVRMPAEENFYGSPGHAINKYGTVAYTSPTSGLVHFLECH